jgi:hypothetical protein
MDTFHSLLQKRRPVSKLKKFEFSFFYGIEDFDIHLFGTKEEEYGKSPSYVKWLLEVLHWVIVERKTSCVYESYMIGLWTDIRFPTTFRIICREFLLANRFTGQKCNSLLERIICSAARQRHVDEMIRRLLDHGAVPLRFSTNVYTRRKEVCDLFDSRLATRRACCAVLTLRRKRELIRHCAPKEIMELIARLVWAQRFSLFPK